MSEIREEIQEEYNEVFTMSEEDFKLEVIDWLETLLRARYSSALQLDCLRVARIEACLDRIHPDPERSSYLQDYLE